MRYNNNRDSHTIGTYGTADTHDAAITFGAYMRYSQRTLNILCGTDGK